MKTKLSRIPTGIKSLDELLIPGGPGNKEPGIVYHQEIGLFGVIFGAAGSGKSVLSLQLCCKFVKQGTTDEPHHAVYVTQEPFEVVEAKIYEHFQFLDKAKRETHNLQKERELPLKWKTKGLSTLTVINLPLDPQRQRAKLEYLLPILKREFSGCPEFSAFDFQNLALFVNKLQASELKGKVSELLKAKLRIAPGTPLPEGQEEPSEPGSLQNALIIILNQLCSEPSFYQEELFKGVILRSETHALLDRNPKNGAQLRRLNRLLLEDAYPKEIIKSLSKRQLLFCLDNAETVNHGAYPKEVWESHHLPKDASLQQSGDKASPASDDFFFKRLRQYCAEQCLNAWFSFEEDRIQGIHSEVLAIATTELAYAADIVIRLGIKVFDNGYRERSLEIVKAKNQPYRRGRHHFTIEGTTNGRFERREDGYGIVIFQSIASQLKVIGRETASSPQPDYKCLLGIREVDKDVTWKNAAEEKRKLLEAQDNKIQGCEPAPYLKSGTISVLVSDLDSIASEIALHFSLQDNEPTLYLTTLHQNEQIRSMIGQYSDLSEAYETTQNFQLVTLFPEHIGEDKLLHDIREWIRHPQFQKKPARRVVLDNIFRLSKKFPLLYDEGHFLAALFAVFRSERVTALVVDMVEVGEGTNPLHESFAAGLADHVFILRHAELRSEVSKIFSVAKLAGLHEPDKLWELQATPARIVAEDRLAFYKGALSGRPEPVEVMLSLFAESKGSPLHGYLQTECEVLKATFGQKINVYTSHPESYGAMQQSVEARNLSALGDCHVISIDEIWLGELIRRDLLQDFYIEHLGKSDAERKRWEHDEYVTAGQNIAIASAIEQMRCQGEAAKSGTRQMAKFNECNALISRLHKGNFAIPARVNVGILAYNPNVWEKHDLIGGGGSGQLMSKTIRGFKFAWCSPLKITRTPPFWNQLVELQTHFIQYLNDRRKTANIQSTPTSIYRFWENEEVETCDDCKKYKKPNIQFGSVPFLPEAGVFTFSMETRETCVSFFLELLLSFTPKGLFPVFTKTDHEGTAGKLNWNRKIWTGALKLMLELLSPWDIMRLSHAAYRPARFERPCLFSRQWFTGWGMLRQTQPGLVPMELPKYKSEREYEPACVSGTWYLGILSGGTAYRAGAQIIKQLTSPAQEMDKLNLGIGLPVRRSLYDAADTIKKEDRLIDASQNLLYAKGMTMVADLKGTSTFFASDFIDVENFVHELNKRSPLGTYIRARLSQATSNRLQGGLFSGTDPDQLQPLADDLNKLISRESVYHEKRFAGIALRDITKKLLAKNPQGITRLRLNRLLLEDAYPPYISRDRPQQISSELRGHRCPFFRETITYYRRISPLLMGLMVDAAKHAVNSKWLWTREDFDKEIAKKLNDIVNSAENRYDQIYKEEKDLHSRQ
jgi:RecA/RadA recombinase